ncbi:hypothetical protein [Mycolicibacterium llatzerense]|uniref:hypothetical protein n=1 Tax=Mycolicibacterium llatzerense TaxID=280871 RepID=UPI0021B57DA0|nr:hypothetical protein [Mycolicibacterium llatzerense]MCT7372709.1 hypothetical protein [Mycolicibacterium llatzerense]
MALAHLSGTYPGPRLFEAHARIAYAMLSTLGIDPLAPIELPDASAWFGTPIHIDPIADQSPWAALMAAEPRRTSPADVLAALADDDTLKLAMHQAHWELFDPWLDAGARYVPEQPNGGRHRLDPCNITPGTWWMAPLPTPPSRPGKHACRCDDCRHERERTALDTATRVLDGPRAYDPDCDACNAPGGPSPEHTAHHYEESAQW